MNDCSGSVTVLEGLLSAALLADLAGERRHRAGTLQIEVVDGDLLAAPVARLERRMDFGTAVSDRTIYLSIGEENFGGVVTERRIKG